MTINTLTHSGWYGPFSCPLTQIPTKKKKFKAFYVSSGCSLSVSCQDAQGSMHRHGRAHTVIQGRRCLTLFPGAKSAGGQSWVEGHSSGHDPPSNQTTVYFICSENILLSNALLKTCKSVWHMSDVNHSNTEMSLLVLLKGPVHWKDSPLDVRKNFSLRWLKTLTESC